MAGAAHFLHNGILTDENLLEAIMIKSEKTLETQMNASAQKCQI